MTKKLAFLGYGLRSKTMLQAFREIEADISVAAVADRAGSRSKRKMPEIRCSLKRGILKTRTRCWGAANRTAYSSARAARCIRRWRSRS